MEDLLRKIKVLEEQLEEEKNSKKYGLVWDERNTQEIFEEKTRHSYPILKENRVLNVVDDFNNQNHILIEGDNYHSLSVLLFTHRENIDMIYIDPPYNTGKEFTYNDKLVSEEDTFKHSKWLSFMNKRLLLAKELLSDKGLIFISIDEHEQAQLKLLCDEIFGEENYVENLIWVKNSTKNNTKTFSTNHEYILVYAKSKFQIMKGNGFKIEKPGLKEVNEIRNQFLEEDLTKFSKPHLELEKRLNNLYKERPELKGISGYKYVDEEDYKIYASDNSAAPGKGGKFYDVFHPITKKVCKTPSNGWRYKEDTLRDYISKNMIKFGNDENTIPRFKRYLDTVEKDVYKSVIFNNDDGIKELSKVFGEKKFDYPKPISLIKELIKVSTTKESIVLDFFAGSGTMLHALLQLNKEDGGNRKGIICTNNESNICKEVTYPRVKRAILGYKDSNNQEVKGLGGNLRYYETEFLKKSQNKDQMLLDISKFSRDILSVKESVYDLVQEHNSYSVLHNNNKTMGIYHDYIDLDEYKHFIEVINGYPGEKIIYCFSFDENIDEELSNLSDFELKPIPTKILSIFEEVKKLHG